MVDHVDSQTVDSQTVDSQSTTAAGPPTWSVPGPDRTSVRRAIIGIAVPVAMVELAGLLTMIGVFALMSRMGDQTLYVRSFYMPVASVFLAVFVSFLISNQVASALSRGRGRPGDVLPVAFSFARLWLVFGLLLIVLAFVGAGWIADVYHVPPAARGEFVAFVRWMSLAELTQVAVALAASSLRGFDQPRAGSAILLVSSAIQLAGVALVGLGAGMGAMSVPLFTALGALVGGGLGYVQLRKHNLWAAGQWRQWRPAAVGLIIGVGLPIAITQLILFGANSALLVLLSGIGPVPTAGYSSAGTFQFLILMPGIVLGTATAIVLNQQRGAGRPEWLGKTLQVGLEVTVLLYVVIALVVWLGNDALAALMTGSPEISNEVALYFGIVGLTYVFNGPVLAALSVMEQIGAGLVAVSLNFVYFLAIVVAGGLVLEAHPSSTAFYQTIAWCNVVGVTLVAAAVLAVRKVAAKPRDPAARHP